MSGSIGGDRIPRSAVQNTVDWYVSNVLKGFSGFKSAKISGSYNTTNKVDHGDIDLVLYIEGKDVKEVKKAFLAYLDSLPDDITVPFRSGRNKGKKSQTFGTIATCQVPMVGFTGLVVQIDNNIVLSEKEQEYHKSFLDLSAEKQALLMGLARVIMMEENPEQILARLGIKKIPILDKNQELEFELSESGLRLRKVTLDGFKEVNGEDIWTSRDWSDVKKLFKNFNIEGSYDDLLTDLSTKIKNPRSKRRIVGMMNSVIHIGATEKGTAKGDGKQRAIDRANNLLGSVQESSEESTGKIALYGGGFKPPHRAHFAHAEKLSKGVDKLIIFIGPKVRSGVPITAEQSKSIWEIYKDYLPVPVEVRISESSPILDIYKLIEREDLKSTTFIIGRDQRSVEEDKKYLSIIKNPEKYSNVILKTLNSTANSLDDKLSASSLRSSVEMLKKGDWIPSCLDRDDTLKVLDIVIKPLENQIVQEEFREKVEKVLLETKGLSENSSGTPIPPTSVISSKDKSKLSDLYTTLEGIEGFEQVFYLKFNQSFILIKSKAGSPKELSDLYTKLLTELEGQFTVTFDRDYIHIKPYVHPEWAQQNITGGYNTDGDLQESYQDPNDIQDFDWAKSIASMVGFFEKNGVALDPLPEIILNKKVQKGGFLDKTGEYNPVDKVISVYTNNRNPVDSLRTVAHELYHHAQNLQGKVKQTASKVTGDKSLEELEGEAYKEGNLLYRKWLESNGVYD